jgi:hypothetical protein
VLALSYNGTSLKPTTTVPLPKGSTDAALTGVSCTTTRYCVAIGVAAGDTSAFGTAGSLNIIEMWNGAKWTLAHSAAASTATTQLSLSGVSCATAAFCVLAGATDSFNATSLVSTLYAASWNGKKLTTLKPATVSGGAGYLEPAGVSCATTSNCAVTGAVIGDITSSTPSVAAFTEIWNGKDWQLAKLAWPKGIKDSFTLGVSCYAAHDCEAVGVDGASTANNAPGGAAAAAFTGTAGALQGVPAPSKGDSTAFGGVGCLPSGRCVAIGETGKTTAKSPALMTGVWNGKAWKLGPGF